jgi:hypothetical protein
MKDIPNREEQIILSTLIDYIKANNLLPNSVDIELAFYDSTTKYPISGFENEDILCKRWQIGFQNIKKISKRFKRFRKNK